MKKDKELESNIISDLFHELIPERKQRPSESIEDENIEDDGYMEGLRERKRARYEALKRKAREGWSD